MNSESLMVHQDNTPQLITFFTLLIPLQLFLDIKFSDIEMIVQCLVLHSRPQPEINLTFLNSKFTQLDLQYFNLEYVCLLTPHSITCNSNLLAPPASGDTMTERSQSAMCSLIHFSTAGSAYKLSTGISKKP